MTEEAIAAMAVKHYGRSMAQIREDSEILLIVADRCREWAGGAKTNNEYQTATGMAGGLMAAAYNVNDPERTQLIRFARAMISRPAK